MPQRRTPPRAPLPASATISSPPQYHSASLGYPSRVSVDRRTLISTGLAMQATRGRTAPRAFSVQVLGQNGGTVALGARPVTVGAHSSCDLVLADPQVSRRHAELAITTDGIRIK